MLPLCPYFPQLRWLMLFLSSPFSIYFASELQSAFVTSLDENVGVRCLYVRDVHYNNYSARDEKLFRSAVLLESSIFCYCREIKHGCQLAFPMRSITFWAESRDACRGTQACSKTHNPTHADKQSFKLALIHYSSRSFTHMRNDVFPAPFFKSLRLYAKKSCQYIF